jgi:L-threonylcarbamoyladenylate synthase
MIISGSDPAALQQAAKTLARGDLVGWPTETVYGLGADADNPQAVAQVYAAKGRPSDHPLIVHVTDASQVDHYAVNVPAVARRLIAAHWPGPLTLILRRRPGVAEAAAGGQDSIGLRCPDHPVGQALLRAAQTLGVHGVAAPSANRFGRVSPTTAQHVQDELGEALLILDGGACQVGIESAIVDCTRDHPVLLRPGMLTIELLSQSGGERVLTPQAHAALQPAAAPAPRASGTLEAHYAPMARVHLLERHDLQQRLARLAQDPQRAHWAVWAFAPLEVPAGVLVDFMPTQAEACAHELFGQLRRFDGLGVQQLLVEMPPPAIEWDGVRDRLKRAAAA